MNTPSNSQAIALYQKRRTQYALGRNLKHQQQDITRLIQHAVREVPSSFNSQSTRAVILYGQHSQTFWNLVKEALRPLVPAEAFATTESKLAGFAAGVGTVLFFIDSDVIKQQQEQFPLYADNFPVWGEHSSGMAQFAVWTVLAEAGIGASLQHYNPVVDKEVQRQWDIPPSWQLRAQMPFGSHEADFPQKSYIEDERRFKVFA